jgi:hypothetical protein
MRFMAQHRSGRVLSITSSPDDAPLAVVSSVDGAEITEVEAPEAMFDSSRIEGEDVAKLLSGLRIKRSAEVGRAEE